MVKVIAIANQKGRGQDHHDAQPGGGHGGRREKGTAH